MGKFFLRRSHVGAETFIIGCTTNRPECNPRCVCGCCCNLIRMGVMRFLRRRIVCASCLCRVKPADRLLQTGQTHILLIQTVPYLIQVIAGELFQGFQIFSTRLLHYFRRQGGAGRAFIPG